MVDEATKIVVFIDPGQKCKHRYSYLINIQYIRVVPQRIEEN